jgi:hypothetical protein
MLSMQEFHWVQLGKLEETLNEIRYHWFCTQKSAFYSHFEIECIFFLGKMEELLI